MDSVIRILGDNKMLMKTLQQSQEAFGNLQAAADSAGISIDQALGRVRGNILQLASIAGIATGGMSLIHKVVGTRSEFQNTEAMFKVFLKDGEKATAFMKEIQTYSFNNVFDFGTLTKQSAQLLAYGTEQEKVIDKLNRLSQIAAGTGGTDADLAMLVNAYNRVKSTDIMDSRMEQSLAAKGIRVKEILGMADTDKVHFEDLDKALQKVTDEGGMYFGMMEEKMKTLGDSVGLLQDRVMQMFNDMGKDIQEPLRNIIYNFADLVENWRDFVPETAIQKGVEGLSVLSDHLNEIVSILEKVAITWGATKAAMAMEKAYNNAQTLKALNLERDALVQVREEAIRAKQAELGLEIRGLETKVENGSATGEEEIQLMQKKMELQQIISRQQDEELVGKGRMTQARADEIASIREEIDATIISMAQKKQSISDEISGNSNLIDELKKKLSVQEEEVAYNRDILAGVEKAAEAFKGETAEQQRVRTEKELSNATSKARAIAEQIEALETRNNELAVQGEALATSISTAQKARDTAATNANTKAKSIGAKVTAAMNGAVKKLSLSLKAMWASNPIGLIAGAVAGLVSLVKWLKEVHDNQPEVKAMADYNETVNEAAEAAGSSIAKFERLRGVMKSHSEDSEEYKAAQAEIIAQYKKYLPELNEETATVENLTMWYDKLINNIKRATLAKEASNKKTDVEQNLDDLQSTNWGEVEKKLEEKFGAEQGQVYLAAFKNAVVGHEEDLLKEINKGGTVISFLKKSIPNAEDLGMNLLELKWQGILRTITKNTKQVVPIMQEVAKLEQDIENGKGAENEVDEEQTVASGKDVNDIIKSIREQEKTVKDLRAKYAASGTKDAGDALKIALEDQKSLTEAYSKMTGKSWEDGIKLEESNLEEKRKLSNERIKLLNSEIKEARSKRKADYDQQIKEINQQEAKWNKDHKGQEGAKAGLFNQQRENAKLQLQLDLNKMDEQFKEWKVKVEKEKFEIKFDIETERLQYIFDNATTYADKVAARSALRAQQDKNLLRQNEQSRDDELLSKLGGDRDKLQQYNAEMSKDEGSRDFSALNINPQTLTELQAITATYKELYGLEQQRTNQQRLFEDDTEDIDNYVSFLQEKLELDKWYAEQQEELALGNLGKTTSADLKRQYDAKMQMVLKDKGIDATEMEVSNMAGNMIALISGVSADAIEKESQAFFKEIDKMIEQRKRELLGDNYDDYTSQQGIIDTNTAILNDENATDDQKQAAEDAITEAKAKQLQYETQVLSTDSQLLKLTQTRKTTEDAVLKVQSTATQVSARDTKKQAALWSAVADMMNRANSAVRGIAETLGDSLSPEGQKALNTMAEITEFATSSISSIQYVTETSTRLMETTANSAAGAIRMVETASVILAVISLAIQAIQAIVKIVSQYSAYQKASDRLEDQKEKVAALVKENGKLEKSYKKLEGTSKYFKGMSEQAKDYDQIIAEQEKAVQAAEDMVASAKTKKKREEAKKALKEQKDLLDEYKEKQEEVFRQLQQELIGTDLASFSESLADAFVEGFEDGTMSMKESFEQTIDDMMKTMMKKQLASKIGDIFKDTFDKFNNYTADGALTNKEMQAIMSEIDAKSAEAELLAGQYQQMMEKMGLLDSNVDAKSGGFSAMSQDTAEELNGRFTSLQMTGISLLDNSNVMKELLVQTFPQMIAFMQQNYQHNVVAEQMAESQIDQLKIIADNTGLLAETNRRLANIQSSTDKL